MKRIAVCSYIHIPILQEEEFKRLMPGSVSRGNRHTEKETLRYQEGAYNTVIFSALQNGKAGK